MTGPLELATSPRPSLHLFKHHRKNEWSARRTTASTPARGRGRCLPVVFGMIRVLRSLVVCSFTS